jgi:hypothetical protein
MIVIGTIVGHERFLDVDHKRIELEDSLKYVNHSPTGFSWGYGGSGPSQAAYAILLEYTKDSVLSQKLYWQFRNEFVSKWPMDEPVYEDIDMDAWLESHNVRIGKPKD